MSDPQRQGLRRGRECLRQKDETRGKPRRSRGYRNVSCAQTIAYRSENVQKGTNTRPSAAAPERVRKANNANGWCTFLEPAQI
jgi:hypothetical protein